MQKCYSVRRPLDNKITKALLGNIVPIYSYAECMKFRLAFLFFFLYQEFSSILKAYKKVACQNCDRQQHFLLFPPFSCRSSLCINEHTYDIEFMLMFSAWMLPKMVLDIEQMAKQV